MTRVVATSDKAFLGDGPSRQVVAPLCRRRPHGPCGRSARLAARLAAGAERRQIDQGADRRAQARARTCSTSRGAIGKRRSRRRSQERFRARGRRSLCGGGALKPGARAEARALASCVAALHYSRRSAALAAALAKASRDVEADFLELVHVCLSHDVAATYRGRSARPGSRSPKRLTRPRFFALYRREPWRVSFA